MKRNAIFLINLLVILDQLTKALAISLLGENSLKVLKFLNFNIIYNKGISFGLFSNLKYGNIGFAIMATAIIGYLIYWLYQSILEYECYGLSLVIGGAVSNLIDRLIYKGVVDFLEFHYKEHYFPSFNLADSSIFLGVCILLFFSINWKKEKKSI